MTEPITHPISGQIVHRADVVRAGTREMMAVRKTDASATGEIKRLVQTNNSCQALIFFVQERLAWFPGTSRGREDESSLCGTFHTVTTFIPTGWLWV